MPIVDVTIVVSRNGVVAPDMAQSLADGVDRALISPPGETWLRLHVLDHDQYAENDAPLPSADLPVFVVVLSRQIPVPTRLASSIAALTRVVSEVTDRPSDRVHVEYAPSALGRVSFGGKLIE